MSALPPFAALRAFEALGRTGRLRPAAAELGVSPSAVSHQIRNLEAHLGVAVVRRAGRGLELTATGQALLPSLTMALGEIAKSVGRIRVTPDTRPLSVAMTPGFALRWLAARLHRFRERHADHAIRVMTINGPVDWDDPAIDMGIRFGDGQWPGLHVTSFLGDAFFPVISPALLQRGPAVKSIADLAHHTQIRDGLSIGWDDWLAMAGASPLTPKSILQVEDPAIALQYAIDGYGVALGRRTTAGGDIASGRLVVPIGPAVETLWQHHILCRPEDRMRPAIVAFRDWLLEEARLSRDGSGESGGDRQADGSAAPVRRRRRPR